LRLLSFNSSTFRQTQLEQLIMGSVSFVSSLTGPNSFLFLFLFFAQNEQRDGSIAKSQLKCFLQEIENKKIFSTKDDLDELKI
jgi:hypothetical protein